MYRHQTFRSKMRLNITAPNVMDSKTNPVGNGNSRALVSFSTHRMSTKIKAGNQSSVRFRNWGNFRSRLKNLWMKPVTAPIGEIAHQLLAEKKERRKRLGHQTDKTRMLPIFSPVPLGPKKSE